MSAGTLLSQITHWLCKTSTLDYSGTVPLLELAALSTRATFGGLKGNQNLLLTNGSSKSVALTVGQNGQSTGYSGVLGGGGSLSKVGAGVLTLSGANIYTGGTVVSGGALLAGNTSGSATGTGEVTVSGTGTTLGGSGTIAGPVTIGAAAKLQGGNGTAGTKLTLSGALTLADNSIVQLTLGSGAAHSTLTRSGSGLWTFASKQAFSFIDTGAHAGFYDNIITGLSGVPNLSPGSWVVTNPGWTGTFATMARAISISLCSL